MKLLTKHNLYVGTNAERLASFATPPHEGADYLETDTGATFTFVYGDWEPVGGGGGATTFLGLTDTPAAYAGAGGQMVIVDPGETGLSFTATVPAHNIVGASHTVTGSAFQVVGLTGANTLGLLTPSSDVVAGADEALLKSSADGYLALNRLAVGSTAIDTTGIRGYLSTNTTGSTIPYAVEYFLVLNPASSPAYSLPAAGRFLSQWQSTQNFAGTLHGFTTSVQVVSGGTVATAVGGNFILQTQNSSAVITTGIGVRVQSPSTAGGGSMGTVYGVKIENQSATTAAFALHTGLGDVSLGDDLTFRQAATIATAAGALTLEPGAGDDLLINLSTTGDLIVNTNQFVVDTSTGRVGIGGNPSYKLEILDNVSGVAYISHQNSAAAATTNYAGLVWQLNTSTQIRPAAAFISRFIDTTDATRTGQFSITTPSSGSGLTARLTVGPGVQVGAPTGGDKGAGTINTAADIYKNNSAFVNPDYALEFWRDGRISQFADNPGAATYRRLTLAEIKSHIVKNLRLPGFSDEPAGIFERGDLVLEKIEEIFTHLIEMNERLEAISG